MQRQDFMTRCILIAFIYWINISVYQKSWCKIHGKKRGKENTFSIDFRFLGATEVEELFNSEQLAYLRAREFY
jgi:hypothetical protein